MRPRKLKRRQWLSTASDEQYAAWSSRTVGKIDPTPKAPQNQRVVLRRINTGKGARTLSGKVITQ